MKTLNNIILELAIAVLLSTGLYAQNTGTYSMFWDCSQHFSIVNNWVASNQLGISSLGRRGLLGPYRTQVWIAGCLGLRASEIMPLKWSDLDFEGLTLLVERSMVHGRGSDVKTEYSRDRVPLDPGLVEILLSHRERYHRTKEDWLFANPGTSRPYHQDTIQQNHIRKASKVAGLGDGVGWHTFRHSYRSWLDDTGAPTTVQKELMRHASIQTTMNVYGKAMTDSKRQAHSKVVELILKSRKPESVGDEHAVRAVGA